MSLVVFLSNFLLLCLSKHWVNFGFKLLYKYYFCLYILHNIILSLTRNKSKISLYVYVFLSEPMIGKRKRNPITYKGLSLKVNCCRCFRACLNITLISFKTCTTIKIWLNGRCKNILLKIPCSGHKSKRTSFQHLCNMLCCGDKWSDW